MGDHGLRSFGPSLSNAHQVPRKNYFFVVMEMNGKKIGVEDFQRCQTLATLLRSGVSKRLLFAKDGMSGEPCFPHSLCGQAEPSFS